MSQLEFFGGDSRVVLDDDTGSIVYHRSAIDRDLSQYVFEVLLRNVEWRSERRMMYERQVDVPRLVARLGVEDADAYGFAPVRAVVERLAKTRFTSVGLNLYRDGNDSVAPHNDRLIELREGEPIALLSLGATRLMTIRSKATPRRTFDLDLEHGSVLIMSYETQRHYDHGIPKTKMPSSARISAAFRVRPKPSAIE